MAYRGGATFAWQSDYAQFYLVDADHEAFVAPIDITAEMMAQSFAVCPNGLVIYTEDCLRQLIEVRLFDAEAKAEPGDWRSDRSWTRIATITVTFPSRRFTVSSPSRAGTEACGPWFEAGASKLKARLQWMELGSDNYEAARPHDDVIRIDLWPA